MLLKLLLFVDRGALVGAALEVVELVLLSVSCCDAFG